MTSTEREVFLRMCVLNEVSDDYESFDKIVEGVMSLAAEVGINPSSSEIEAALRHLVGSNLVEPFILSGRERPRQVNGWADAGELRPYYFFQTEAGKEVHRGNVAYWPVNWPAADQA